VTSFKVLLSFLMIDSNRSHYHAYIVEKRAFCSFVSLKKNKTCGVKQKSKRFKVIFKREKEWWCVIAYNPQALGLNVFGLMKWIPYSPPFIPDKTIVTRTSSGNTTESCVWVWFVSYDIRKTRSHTCIYFKRITNQRKQSLPLSK